MSDIQVIQRAQQNQKYIFDVIVSDSNGNTNHIVEIDKDYYTKLSDGNISPAELVKKSFEFLLVRESKESILHKFDLSVIQTYFPEYEDEIRD